MADVPKKPSDGATAIRLGALEGRLPGAWTMEAADSTIRTEADHESTALVERVKGELFTANRLESRFVADSGEADTKTGRLVLSGRVRVTSERDSVYLTANRVTYEETLGLVIAEGNVTVHMTSGRISGPFDKLVATPGLDKVGTADRFGL